MIGGRYVDDEVLRVVAHDGAHRSGNKNCSRLGIKRLVFDQANLLVACLLVRVANLDPRGFLACPLRRLLRRLGYLLGLLGPSEQGQRSDKIVPHVPMLPEISRCLFPVENGNGATAAFVKKNGKIEARRFFK